MTTQMASFLTKGSGATTVRENRFLQLRLRRLLPRPFVGAKRLNHILHLCLEFLRILPPSREVGCQALADRLRLPTLPLAAEQVAVKVQRNQGQYLLLALFHELAFLLERAINLIVNPPACQRVFGAAEQDLVPHPNPTVNLFVDVVARQKLLFVQPAAYAAALQRIVQAAGKQLVLMTVADEAGVELDGPSHHRADVGDEPVGDATSAQKGLGNFAAGLVDGVNADGGGAVVPNGFEAMGTTQIDVSEVCFL